jgi:hypothetical protein
MIREISNDIKAAFQNNRNGVTRLLIVHIAAFAVIGTGK